MPKNVAMPDGSVVEFPDTMSDDDIGAVISKQQGGGQQAPPEQPGFFAKAASTLGSDLLGMAKGAPEMVLNTIPGVANLRKGYEDIKSYRETGKTTQELHQEQQKAAGYGPGYRYLATPLAEGIGVNVPGMEQSAAEGSAGGVVGHAAAVPVVMAATEGAMRGIPAARAALKSGEVKPATVPKVIEEAHANFQKAIPPTKSTPYAPEDLQRARPYLEDAHAESPITKVTDVRDAADTAVTRIENKIGEAVRQIPGVQIKVKPLEAVEQALEPINKLRDGTTEEGLKSLERYHLDEPMTLEEADATRRLLNKENEAFNKKNNYDRYTARVTSPEYAAREAAANALRDGIYDQLGDQFRELRQTEGSILKVRNAAENQIFNGEKGVSRTGSTSIPGRVGRGIIQVGTTGGGAALGGAIGGTPGATAGALVGAGVGEAINRVAFPGNLTRNALIEKSFAKSFTEGAKLPDIPARPPIRGLLKSAPTELGSHMEPIEPESPYARPPVLKRSIVFDPASGKPPEFSDVLAKQTVGTAEGAKNDTAAFAQARKELGSDASMSKLAQRAQAIKTGGPSLGEPKSLDLDPESGIIGARYPILDEKGNVLGNITATREAGNPDAPLHITGIGSGTADLTNQLGPARVKQFMKQIMEQAGTKKIEGMRVGGALGRNIGKTQVSHKLD